MVVLLTGSSQVKHVWTHPRVLTGVRGGESGSLGEYVEDYSVFGRWQVADSFSQLATEDFADRLFDWLGLVPDTGIIPGTSDASTHFFLHQRVPYEVVI